MTKTLNFLKASTVFSIWLAIACVAYMLTVTHTFERYFDVGQQIVPQAVASEGFSFATTSRPLARFNGSYKVILRDALTRVALKEYPKSGVFPYDVTRDESGKIISGYPDPAPFDWWVGRQGELKALPEGLAYIETCWTIHDRPFPLPDVTGCGQSNAFRIE